MRLLKEAREEDLPSIHTAPVPANEQAAYRDLTTGYNRLKDGTASTLEVDELRKSAKSFLTRCHADPGCRRKEVRALLDWLDYARTIGKVTIKVWQLRERKKWSSWAIDCGIEAGGRTVKATQSVKGDTNVQDCVLNVPWDPDVSINVWMHLIDSGFETCWGNTGPIGGSSKMVLQDQSGLVREFHADQFDKDFKLRFTINRNFASLPVLMQ